MVNTRASGSTTHDGKVYQRTSSKKKLPRIPKAPTRNTIPNSEPYTEAIPDIHDINQVMETHSKVIPQIEIEKESAGDLPISGKGNNHNTLLNKEAASKHYAKENKKKRST
ncbi:uncharacterized protein LOC121767868 isoform X1 [Salvia splendens]|uniref:uncharacterized protein LOC121767868 isoform X1 n=1 Tax=Salvia splendens TaxID=180675 RepID=UPI001C277D95|nr:uncharacterized protein LOC121767868 isoform X1 [Salvia splendens]